MRPPASPAHPGDYDRPATDAAFRAWVEAVGGVYVLGFDVPLTLAHPRQMLDPGDSAGCACGIRLAITIAHGASNPMPEVVPHELAHIIDFICGHAHEQGYDDGETRAAAASHAIRSTLSHPDAAATLARMAWHGHDGVGLPLVLGGDRVVVVHRDDQEADAFTHHTDPGAGTIAFDSITTGQARLAHALDAVFREHARAFTPLGYPVPSELGDAWASSQAHGWASILVHNRDLINVLWPATDVDADGRRIAR